MVVAIWIWALVPSEGLAANKDDLIGVAGIVVERLQYPRNASPHLIAKGSRIARTSATCMIPGTCIGHSNPDGQEVKVSLLGLVTAERRLPKRR